MGYFKYMHMILTSCMLALVMYVSMQGKPYMEIVSNYSGIINDSYYTYSYYYQTSLHVGA